MLWRFTKKFQFAADRVIPDSFVFCLILALIVYVSGIIVTDAGPLDMLGFCYDGLFGGMLVFGFQIALVILFASTAAKAPQFERILGKISGIPKTPASALIFMLIFAALASWINWAFGLILTPILSVQLCKKVKGLHLPIMIASGYAMMIMIQPICLSTPVVNYMATQGHALQDITGIVPVTATAFNPVGLVTYALLFLATILIVVFTKPPADEILGLDIAENISLDEKDQTGTPVLKKDASIADRLNNNRILMLFVSLGFTIFICLYFSREGLNLNLFFVIFLFITLCTWLYPTPISFMNGVKNSVGSIPQVLVQFPFYGAIMQMMAASGLTLILSNALINAADANTLPLFSYLSASFINLFVPSQGGQWAIQGPIIAQAAKALQVDHGLIASAFMYGDEATNLLQPFYIIPALSLVGMKLKHVWGYMAFIWVAWFVISCFTFTLLPSILM